jgi:hypothetical protein
MAIEQAPELEVSPELLGYFKALADASRLRLAGLLASAERSVDELATLLELRPPTVSHHLAKLKAVGLVRMRSDGTTHLYRLDTDALRRFSRQALHVERLVTPSASWDDKVLRDFLNGARLKEIPASRKKRDVILRWLAQRFELDQRYTEKEVNAVLAEHHADVATLRRELIGAKLLRREQSIYWRPVLTGPESAGTMSA